MLIVSLFLVIAMAVLTQEQPPAYLPKTMVLADYKFRGNARIVKCEGDSVVLITTIEAREQPRVTVRPSEGAWKEFWKEMDAVGIWKWDPKYIDKTIADGHSWEIKLEVGDRKAHVIGSNMFPPTYERYEKAVRKLLGEKEPEKEK